METMGLSWEGRRKEGARGQRGQGGGRKGRAGGREGEIGGKGWKGGKWRREI